MAGSIIDINESTIKKYVDSLRPDDPEIRKQLDFGYTYDGKTIILFEIRPFWDNPTETQHIEFVKIRFYKTKHLWKLYWMRASGKWELYEPFPESTYLEKMLETIAKDEYGCFHG